MPPGGGVGTEHAVKCTPLVWTEKYLRTKVSHPAAEPVKTALQHCMKVRVLVWVWFWGLVLGLVLVLGTAKPDPDP